MPDLTLADLVRNGTMNAQMGAVLWAAAEEQMSFLTVAVPRMAGKSTTSRAVLAMRLPGVPVHRVAGEPETMAQLKQQRLGGYIVVEEFSRAPVPGYIWGEPVRRVFDTLEAGYSLQTCLHAPGVEAGMLEVTRGNGISDKLASTFKLVIYIEVAARGSDVIRRVSELYEVHAVENGIPVGHTLFKWRPEDDSFEVITLPHQWARDRELLAQRTELLDKLARDGTTSESEVAAAVDAFRRERALI